MRAKGVMDYLMIVIGVLAALASLVLLAAFGIVSFEESPGILTLLLSFPVLVDIFILSPGIPSLFLILTIVPLLLMVVLALRILIEVGRKGQVSKRHVMGKYSLNQLILFGIGATAGPSVFVVLPEAVSRYGPSTIIGMILASLSALLLAILYAKMDSLTYSMGSPSVGGPAFVKKAYGSRHPAYMASRFSMWVANTSLAAFNMLVLMDVITIYVIPDLLALAGASGLAETLNLPTRVLIFILALLALKYSKSEASLVKIQSLLGPLFVALFSAHVIALAALAWSSPSPPKGFDALSLPINAVTSMAFVYMVVFGFQEIQSLAEGIPGGPEEREKTLRKALIVSVALPALLFAVYTAALSFLGKLPRTSIPAVDITYGWLRPLTEGALLLGIATTFIPALVNASNHLRELLIDVFEVRREIAESPIGKYLVAFFVLVLLASNATYLVELTDFGVLVAIGIIAASEIRLSKLAGRESKLTLPLASSGLTALAAIVLALASPDVAFGGILFILAATIALGVAAYELEVLELFTLVCSILALIAAPPVVGAMRELSGVGALSPSMVAFLPFAQVALDILAISTLALMIYMILRIRRYLMRLLRPILDKLITFASRFI